MDSLNARLKPLSIATRTAVPGLVFSVVLALGLHADSPAIRAAEGPRILRESTRNVEIRFSTPELQVRQVTREGELFHEIVLEEFGTTGAPGTPAVPVQRRMVAVPPGAAVSLEVELAKPISLTGAIDPLPVPYGEPVLPADDPAGLPVGVSSRYAADSSAYASEIWTPAEIVRIADQGAWRGIDFVTLEFTPVQFRTGKRAARYVPWANAHLSFDRVRGEEIASLQKEKRPADRLSGMVEGLFLNPDTALSWKRAAGGGLQAAGSGAMRQSTALAPTNSDRWLIEVEAAGLHKLRYSDLSAAGVPLNNPNPGNLHLVNGAGDAVAMWFDDQDDNGTLNAGDALYFYAPDPVSRWSWHAFYWLTKEATPGLRMSTVDVSPTAQTPVTEVWATHTENPPNGYIQYAVQGWDKWVHSLVYSTRSATLEFPDPTGFVVTPDNVTLTLRMVPYPLAAKDNNVSAILNGTPLMSNVSWPYWPSLWRHTVSVDSSLIQANNALEVSVQEISWVDGIDLEYRRELVAQDNTLAFRHDPAGEQRFEVSGFTDPIVHAFDITALPNPLRLESGDLIGDTFAFTSSGTSATEYLLAGTSAIHTPVAITHEPVSSLWDTSHAVDYLVVSHPDFISALGPLLAHRQGQGLTTLVADVTEVYKEFGDGTPNPEGIYNFVKYAYDNGATRPAYLLLVGDGHYDMLDYQGTGTSNPIPPYLADKDPYIGETTTDYQFTLVDGPDEIGDLLVGRLAVETADETTAIVNKILDYETNPPADPPANGWRRRALLVADQQPDPDEAGNFHDESDRVISHYLPFDMDPVRVYLGTTEYPTDYMAELEVRDAISDTLNTEGAAFMQYVGHGRPSALGSPAVWDANRDVGFLDNAVYPLSLTWTCWDNYHIQPEVDRPSLAEEMVTAQDSGSIATFGPVGLDTVASHDVLARGFFDAWFNDGINELGQTVLNAKLYVYRNAPGHKQLLYTFMQHGDPALRLPCEWYGDLNGDDAVTGDDLSLAAGGWAQPVGPLDNSVTVEHLTKIAAQYGVDGAACTVPEP